MRKQSYSLSTNNSTLGPKVATAGAGCLFLFAIPFFAAGMFCLGGVLWSYWKAYQGRSWVEVPAQFEKQAVEADPQAKQENGKPTYSYNWQGRTYYGNKVSAGFISSGEGGDDPAHNGGGAALRREVSCFVNPDNPEEAALHRPTVRFAALGIGIFALSHGGIGLGLLFGSIQQLRRSRRKKTLTSQFPTEPWNWREDWAALKSRPTFRSSRWIWTYVAAIWFLVSWIGVALLLTEPLASNSEKLWAVVVALVGLIPILIAWRKWRLHLALRSLVIEFASVPLRPSETVKALLMAPEALLMDPSLSKRLHLRCMRKTSEGVGKGRRTADTPVWEAADEARLEDFMRSVEGNARCTVTLTIPQRTATTAIERAEVGIRWELALLDDSGKSLVEFPLPVFCADDSPAPEPEAEIDDDRDEEEHKNWSREETLRRFALEKIEVSESGDTKSFFFPPRRHELPANLMAIMATAFTVLGIVPLFAKIHFVTLVWLACVVGVTWMALRLNFQRLTIQLNSQGMEILRQMPWQRTPSRQSFAQAQIQRISPSQRNAEYNGVPFFNVQVTLRTGKSKTVTPEFADFGTASAFASELEQILGIFDPEDSSSETNSES